MLFTFLLKIVWKSCKNHKKNFSFIYHANICITSSNSSSLDVIPVPLSFFLHAIRLRSMGEVNSVKSKCFHPNVRYPLVHILSQDHTYWRPQNDLFWSFIEIKLFSTPPPFPLRPFLREKSRRKWLSELTRSNLGNDFGQFFFILDKILSWKEIISTWDFFFLKRSLWPHFFL